MSKVRRKDVLEYAENISEPELYRCGTCMHYGKSIICSECHGFCGSKYRFDWREYYAEHKESIDNLIKNNDMANDFINIKIGDRVIVFDEYSHDYTQHIILIESKEKDADFITKTNPEGIHFFGRDLDYWNEEEDDYEGDDYITNVDEGNFVNIV